MDIQPRHQLPSTRPASNDAAHQQSSATPSEPPSHQASPTGVPRRNSTSEGLLRQQLSVKAKAEAATAAHASKEVKLTSTDPAFRKIYQDAEKAKTQIDDIADEIALALGGKVAKAPIKSEVRALEKINTDYGGDPARIKDLARNTIIVNEKDIAPATDKLRAKGAEVKVIDGSKDPLGYSGVNSVMMTDAGIYAEIQVNSPAMIYAKEPEHLARTLLSDSTYDEISEKSGEPGGLGHTHYEKWRNLLQDSSDAQKIADTSRDYYNKIRNANAN